MIERYVLELKNLRKKMKEAEKFAESLPIFAEEILEKKYTGKEDFIKFGEKYKDLYLSWGINRGLYSPTNGREITNYHMDKYTGFLFSIYINQYSLFGDKYPSLGLYETMKDAPMVFFDVLNTTFYVTDDQIYVLLERLNEWYIRSRLEVTKFIKELRKEELKRQLSELETK